MEENKLYFDNDTGLFEFAEELSEVFPDRCRDVHGNTCSKIVAMTVEIAEQVDLHEIDESEAKILAGDKAESLRCKYGLSSTGKCGRGILCSMGITPWR